MPLQVQQPDKGVEYLNYIFLDLEWNQPWGKANMITEPVLLHGEIIRIGAVKTDSSLNEISRWHGFVIPKYYKKMNHAVKKVTGLSSDSITYGKHFPEAYTDFLEWAGDSSCVFTWGGEDSKILSANLAVHGIKESHLKFYDLQLIFAHKVAGDGRQLSLQGALEYYDINQELQAHDALNDAVYTSRIGAKMNCTEFIDSYDDMLRQIEIYKSEKYIKTYLNVPSKDAVLSSRRILMCRCPQCSRIMKREKWLPCGGYKLITCAECKTHGEYYVTVRMKKCSSGTYAVTRKIRRLTADYRAIYHKTACSVNENGRQQNS